MIIGAAHIIARIISWSIDVMLLIMQAIIETKRLSKSFQLFALLRLGPHISTWWEKEKCIKYCNEVDVGSKTQL